MEEFYTRSIANKGKKLPLFTPAGDATDHWIMVRGVDSDNFRQAEAKAKRKAVEIAQIEDADERVDAVANEEAVLIASLVADWSFGDECTVFNVVKFLKEAPQIADMINRYSVMRDEFFAKK